MEVDLLNLRHRTEIDRNPLVLVALTLPRSDNFVALLVGTFCDDSICYELSNIVAINSRRVLWCAKEGEVAILLYPTMQTAEVAFPQVKSKQRV